MNVVCRPIEHLPTRTSNSSEGLLAGGKKSENYTQSLPVLSHGALNPPRSSIPTTTDLSERKQEGEGVD